MEAKKNMWYEERKLSIEAISGLRFVKVVDRFRSEEIKIYSEPGRRWGQIF